MKRLFNFLVVVCTLSIAPAHAGSACDTTEVDAKTVMQAMELAYKSRLALDASGAQVALIARVGQDLSKYHLRYSHIAYVWRDHPQGRWLVVHELNQCGTAESALYNEGLGNFFLDSMFAYDTMILVPNAATQAKIVAMLASGTPLKFHASHYNMLSYAFSTKYQNSNQWVLETFAVASATDAKIGDREQAQAWLKMAGYQPITLDIPAMTRLGGRMFRANIAFDDHPLDRRMAGLIDTVTVESVARFIEGRDREAKEIVLSLH
jgi:hypothetical protein